LLSRLSSLSYSNLNKAKHVIFLKGFFKIIKTMFVRWQNLLENNLGNFLSSEKNLFLSSKKDKHGHCSVGEIVKLQN